MNERIDGVFGWIDRGLDRSTLVGFHFPEVQVTRFGERLTIRAKQDANLRAIRIRRIRLEDDANLAGVEFHQIALRVDADELHETADEMLIELLAVVPLQHREDPVGWKRVVVHA